MSSEPSYSEFKPLLAQSVGYGVVVGVGFFFAGVMFILTTLQRKFFKFSPASSEEFTPGLICCGIVSAWTWSATLLQSSTVAYTFGVSGPWWYGVGGTIQVAMFGMVASKVKQNANGAHTFLEIVKTRFGTSAHILFTFYGFLCILLVCGSLLLGGSATVNALTGMNTTAACFLLPIGIALYVIFGGLRATFICDWSHTIILFIIIYIFTFRAYGTSPAIGSVSRLYDLLEQASIITPVVGNQGGSYLTMKSDQGLVFGAITILSGFTGVFCDQGYWQRAIASHPESTTKAYMLGGISWFAVPWAFASCLGLSARALITNASPPNFPTYPSPLSPSQISAGLAAPAAAAVLMGKGGAITVLLVVFMAVTSAASAELIGVSSLFIYRTYFRPNATGDEIVRVSHCFICFWAVWMGCWATILNAVHIDLGWVNYLEYRGCILSPAVIPIGLTVSWSKLTKAGVFCGAIGGACFGMLAWMIGCWKIYGQINISNLAQPYSALCSSLAGLFFSGILTVGVSLLNPADYDFSGTRAIATLEDTIGSDISGVDTSYRASDTESQNEKRDEKRSSLKQPVSNIMEVGLENDDEQRLRSLKTVFRKAFIYSSILTLIVVILVPLPLFFSHYVFSKKFYTFWTACSIIWAFASGSFCIVFPLWESRNEIGMILGSAYRSIRK
ncbi:Na+/solute symporter [Suillus fuscotomentosus]|uniref:Na+/solute symporter n=1 Tax=Suillus fuscotomentosus TaxID=1912939 RepID=A0AAD4DW27_9AGAM|nr:Na+/solute symporter [Suillus fuscotomentosus]KAG1894935.1 Na+/solute symporter [Suillus fuscotomentosus]